MQDFDLMTFWGIFGDKFNMVTVLTILFLLEKQKLFWISLLYVDFCHENQPKPQPFKILQLAPSVPVLLLELTAIKLYESIFE